MFNPHKYLQHKEGNIFVFGDVHGQLLAFLRLIEKIKFDKNKDHLILLGDLIDRGPNSLEVLLYAIDKPYITILAGNHEELMCEAMLSETSRKSSRIIWEMNGGEWANIHNPDLLYMLAVKMYEQFYYMVTVELDSGLKFGLTHGDIIGSSWNELVKNSDNEKLMKQLLWSRKRANAKEAVNFPIRDVDYTLHGHTPKKSLTMFHNSIFIDTVSGASKVLTALNLCEFAKCQDAVGSIVVEDVTPA